MSARAVLEQSPSVQAAYNRMSLLNSPTLRRSNQIRRGKGKLVRSNLSLEQRREQLKTLKAKSKCLRCGGIGHWAGDPECKFPGRKGSPCKPKPAAMIACTSDSSGDDGVYLAAATSTSPAVGHMAAAIHQGKPGTAAMTDDLVQVVGEVRDMFDHSTCHRPKWAEAAEQNFLKLGLSCPWTAGASKNFAGLAGGTKTDGVRSFPFSIKTDKEKPLNGVLESHQLSSWSDETPMLLSLHAQASLGLIKDMVKGAIYRSSGERIPTYRCSRVGLMFISIPSLTGLCRLKIPIRLWLSVIGH